MDIVQSQVYLGQNSIPEALVLSSLLQMVGIRRQIINRDRRKRELIGEERKRLDNEFTTYFLSQNNNKNLGLFGSERLVLVSVKYRISSGMRHFHKS